MLAMLFQFGSSLREMPGRCRTHSLAHQVGAFASVQLGATSFDRFGSYNFLIVGLSILTVGGAITSWVGLRPRIPPARLQINQSAQDTAIQAQ